MNSLKTVNVINTPTQDEPANTELHNNGISHNDTSINDAFKNKSKAEADNEIIDNKNEFKKEKIQDDMNGPNNDLIVNEETDYPKLFEKYQERFHIAYSNSQKLFNIEQAQRETLNFYQRRNNAILDLLSSLEKADSEELLSTTDKDRLKNIIEMNPKLSKYLSLLVGNFDKEKMSKNHKIDLFVTENIPELISDDLKGFEVNPQDIDSWCRRYYPNFVISKFKPLNLKPIGVDSNDKELTQNGSKSVPRKKRKFESEETEEK